jgi:glutathione synthase/RimK-type ligase-like ATP-grasp enzyme
VFAAAIESGATDYRYAQRQVGEAARISATTLEPAIAARCVALAENLHLPLAGIDLRRQEDGGFVCFEVNPSPAFSFYEERTGLPIALAIARYLAGEDD